MKTFVREENPLFPKTLVKEEVKEEPCPVGLLDIMAEKTKVMVNGLPGNMATKVVEHLAMKNEFYIVPYGLTGPHMPDIVEISNQRIRLIKPEDRGLIDKVKDEYGLFLSVDYTHPNAVNENTNFYCENELSFVMGTTGGNISELEELIKYFNIVAVIAPNMGKQIVAFQALMKYAAENFPDAFKGYSLEIVESHQKGKADTSGTAKAMVEYFNRLGIPFTKKQIKMIREPDEQLKIGVPENALKGHAWHTYTLKSPDKSVLFKFTHNVNGRDIYAEGTLDALKFLKKKVDAGERGRVYSMIDILKGVKTEIE